MIEWEVSRAEWVPTAAKRIIRRHWILGYCDRCAGRTGPCAALRWAQDRLRALRMAGNRPSRF
ncbi:hypothetical protein GA0070609_0632 [Micromonospora echinaurantiaca]|uniref:Uncharacterized protein n=1 Tax=Micromonospora echinaurantiaca TaxID=47857 RepID=A0A1C5GYJ6_9ACTN|nr:hypothetical protein GA0070609_0632 [Micromonospora echinaurantiaca]